METKKDAQHLSAKYTALTDEKTNPRTPEEWRKWKDERKAKKRKWKEDKLIEERVKEQEKQAAETAKEETAKSFKENACTISIALPGSILDNAQSPELRTYLAGQIARAAVVFNVDEIVIFDENGAMSRDDNGEMRSTNQKGQCNIQLARILQYLECPQYLRKSFFPQHKDLQYAGLLNPLDSPHHMRADDECEYREGVTLDKPVKPGKGSFVNVGIKKEVTVDRHIQPGVRVTVKLTDNIHCDKKKLKGVIVPPSIPKSEAGLYWGYNVRLASGLAEVFSGCPYKDSYDVLIGTSERGENIDTLELKKFNHMLIVFGGVKGLEASLEAEESLHFDDPGLLFQHYLNTCPNQGSGTIRTEEAILITLSALRPKIQSLQT